VGAGHVEADRRAGAGHGEPGHQHDQQPDRRRAGPQQHREPRHRDGQRHQQRQVRPLEGCPPAEHPDERAERDAGQHHHREQARGDRLRVAEPGHQERVAPHQGEGHHPERAHPVDPEAQPRRRDAEHVRHLLPQAHVGRADRRGDPGWGVAHQREDDDSGQGRHRRGRSEGHRPAGSAEQGCQRDGAQHLPGLADHAGQLVEHGDPSGTEPGRQQSQHRAERHGVPHPQQDAGDDRRHHVGADRQVELAQAHQHAAAGDHQARAEPVGEHADRHLHHGVGEQLDDHEQAHQRGAGREPLGGLDARHPEAGALHHGHDVGEGPQRPHEPGARGVHGVGAVGGGHVPTVARADGGPAGASTRQPAFAGPGPTPRRPAAGRRPRPRPAGRGHAGPAGGGRTRRSSPPRSPSRSRPRSWCRSHRP